jgi:nitrite reductase/ring-hydroxylating ferredoxin subunit
VKVPKTNEIEPGQARLVDVQGKRIALFNIDGTFFAVDSTYTDKGGPLAEGEISGHNDLSLARREVRRSDRGGVGPPAQQAVTPYGVRATESDIEVEM